MVARCVTSNYINKSRRLNKREVHGKKESIESSDWMISHKTSPSTESFLLAKEMRGFLSPQLQYIYDDMVEGYKASQISTKRDIEIRTVRSNISEIRNILKKQYDLERNLC
jgi:DNA-directed RNA polymerase specialized sigma24 family protein